MSPEVPGVVSRWEAVGPFPPPEVMVPPLLFQAPSLMSLVTSWRMRVSAPSQNPLI